MSDAIRWGILATGAIARDFAQGLAILPDADLVAVGSRAQETADRFGDEYGVLRRYGSYEALARDPDVDVAYIATPHNLHRDNTLLCLSAGKAVLCEKPFAINATQAEEMISLARGKKLFLMEAMWNRFHPVVLEMGRLLGEGAIGKPRLMVADFGLGTSFDPEGRLFDIQLGGGALLDLGVYPVALASLVFGPPDTVSTHAHLGPTGVDERAGVVLGYEEEGLAVLHTSLLEKTPSEAMIFGEAGSLRVHGPIYRPSALTLSRPGHDDELIQPPVEGNAYNYEAMEVMRCLRAGELESPRMTLDESLSIMLTLDAIRAEWGLRYPGE
jgi:predicted dehydrogenase